MSAPHTEQPCFRGARAIVIGGSIAGLIAARVLSGHVGEVIVVERDLLPPGDEPRKGVPQGHHVHGLLKRGEDILADLFPGIVHALIQGGAVRVDVGRDASWYHFGAWKQRVETEIMTTFMTRPFLEAELRRRTLALPNVRCLDGREVIGLVAGAGGMRVTGVVVRPQAGATAREVLEGDIVIDASGRGSRTPEWLKALGFLQPEESRVTIHVGYATRAYRRIAPWPFPWKGIYIIDTPPAGKRFGVAFPVEGERLLVSVGGVSHDFPPDDPEGYLEFARGLPVDDLYRAIKDAEPLGDIAVCRFPRNQWRHYERLRRMPEGLLVLGDALCCFNPVYGQGMTTAGLDGMTLDRCLEEQKRLSGGDITGLSARFQGEVAKVIEVPWSMTISEDFRHPETEGARPRGEPLTAWYLRRVHQATARDREVALQFFRVMHLLDPPTTLIHPRILWRTLLRRRGARPAPGKRGSRPGGAPRPACWGDLCARLGAGRAE